MAKDKPSLPSIARYTKNILVGITEEQHKELMAARTKLQVPAAEILRHATFNVYLPSLEKKR